MDSLSAAQFGMIARGAELAVRQTNPMYGQMKRAAKLLGIDTTRRNETTIHRDLEGNYLGQTSTVTRGRNTLIQQRNAGGDIIGQRRERRPYPTPFTQNVRRTTRTTPERVPDVFGVERRTHIVGDRQEPSQRRREPRANPAEDFQPWDIRRNAQRVQDVPMPPSQQPPAPPNPMSRRRRAQQRMGNALNNEDLRPNPFIPGRSDYGNPLA